MPLGRNHDRLSWGDALFLYLERAGMPLNIASVSVFEGPIALAACREHIESKLPLIPRYMQCIVPAPFNIGLPTWERDKKFDIKNHVWEITLKRGTDTEFKLAAGKIFSTTMDRQRPLWDLILVHGLKNNRTGLISRVHHCLADGIAGIGLMNVLLDQDPSIPQPSANRRRRKPSRPKDPWVSTVDSWMGTYSSIVERVLSAQSHMLELAERVVADGNDWPSAQLLRLLPELSRPTERLFFNVTYRGPQKFAWTHIPMDEIKAVREICGGTHNDVVLMLVTAAIRSYAERHGDITKKRLLRIMVPANLRNGDGSGDLGNRISLLPVTIPLDIHNPRKLLAAVHERMEFLKGAHVAELVTLAGGVLSAIPTSLQALAGPVASTLPITPFNLVCTNVPGPRTPLYLLGHQMLDWYPYVPVGGDMALNCAVLSYNGNCYFGFSGDVHAAPELSTLETLVKTSFAELQLAAGIRPPRKKPRKYRIRPQNAADQREAESPATSAPAAKTGASPIRATNVTSAAPIAVAAD